MWFLSILSDETANIAINLILWTGVISVILSFFVINKILRLFPILANYHVIIQVISVLILLTGVYLKGSYSTEKVWRDRVKVVEEKLKAAEIASGKVNTVIEEKIIYQDRIIKEKGETQIKYIDRVLKEKEEIIRYIENCPIPQDIIKEHNLATRIQANTENK